MKKYSFIIYVLIWVIIYIIFLIREIPLSLFFTEDVLIIIHFLFAVVALPTYIIRSLILANRNKKLRKAFIKLVIRVFLPIVVLLLLIKGVVSYNQREDFEYTWDDSIERTENLASNKFTVDGKFRGMSTYAIGRNRKISLKDIVKSNVEWLAVHPYMSQLTETSHEKMSVPNKIGQWSKRDSTFIKGVREAKAKNFRIMLKPHLWVNGGWRANIHFDTTADWDIWFSNYRRNMLHYAHLAEYTGVELFCIGTELRSSLKNKGDEWITLIREIKQIYSGELTYASNWDDTSLYKIPEFWQNLDYIGVQAYFPLTEHPKPSLEEIKNGWDKYIKDLEQLSITYNKPIIFTELGYRADTKATVAPWEWASFFSPLIKKKSEKTQLLAYNAFFQKLWHQEWLAGVFVWQWNSSYDFSVRGKPAENIIARWYSKRAIKNNDE